MKTHQIAGLEFVLVKGRRGWVAARWVEESQRWCLFLAHGAPYSTGDMDEVKEVGREYGEVITNDYGEAVKTKADAIAEIAKNLRLWR